MGQGLHRGNFKAMVDAGKITADSFAGVITDIVAGKTKGRENPDERIIVAIVGMAILYAVSVIPSLKSQMWIVYVAQFIKSTGVIVATGYMWALVPEVISYGEYTTGKRISGIVNALTGIFFKAGMALGGVVPGLVLAYVGFNAKETIQTPFAEQGILWLVCVIPALLLGLAMFIISKYELTDDVIDKINMEIEKRNHRA